MEIDTGLQPADLQPQLDRMWKLSAAKLDDLEASYPPDAGSPVFTVRGRYTARGWTEWTQGFQYGSLLLQFDATGEERFLELGRRHTIARMAPHVSHIGVHDHGFNNISTYGTLWRLIREGRIDASEVELELYALALRVSGAVQAARWQPTSTSSAGGGGGSAGRTGYIYSFNGPQSLFVDTVRSCRSLSLAHLLGHVLMGEQDRPISLLGRALAHLRSTATWNVFYGEGRDGYDVRGRTAHEALFNVTDGTYRCPSTQQGWSPFSTWTRGLAWAVLGFPEQLEFLDLVPDAELEPFGGRAELTAILLRAALATADFYLANTARDGIPYWDTGAPELHRLGDWRSVPADPFNPYEPVDSSAAAIAAQGLLRLGHWLSRHPDRPGPTSPDSGLPADGGSPDAGRTDPDRPDAGQTDPDRPDAGRPGAGPPAADRYWQAGLTVASAVFAPPYLSESPEHQGLILHSVYHRPNGWDHVADGQQVPNGESSMWGDYHARELALYLQRQISGGPYLAFFGPDSPDLSGQPS